MGKSMKNPLGESAEEEEEISLTFSQPTPVTLRRNLADCSNVFKGFIGSAMVGLPFAVSQTGIGLVLVGTFIIAVLTDYGCVLIVKCKQRLIEKALESKLHDGVTDANELREAEATLGKNMSFGEVAKRCLGSTGIYLTNTALMVTQFGFTIGYFIFFGNTLRSIAKHFVGGYNTTALDNSDTLTADTIHTSAWSNSSLIIANSSSTDVDLINNIFFFVANPQFLNSPAGFATFLTVPLPLLILISFVRDIRKLGPVSVIANTSILVGFAATLIFMVIGIHKLHRITWFNFRAFPILFGQVTSAYEGIGTVLSIESSMGENRAKYRTFLHLAVIGCFFVLTSFGSVGYLRFGHLTCQLVTANLRGPIAIALQCLLFVGILFTYPLQIYPCIHITEVIVLKVKKWRRRKVAYTQIDDSREVEKSMEDISGTSINSSYNSNDDTTVVLKTWEGNIIRTVLVLFTAVIALVFRFQFVYIAALTGAIGSSLLSYVIPALCHIRLIGREKWWLIGMDVFLIIFGAVGGVSGVVTTVIKLIDSFNTSHQEHC